MSLAKTSANVDIIADDLLQQHLLKTALMHFGFKIILITNPSKMKDKSGLTVEVDVWVVDIVDEETEHLWLDNLIDGDVPVLFGTGEAPQCSIEHYLRWEKRLFAKMKKLLGDTP